MAYAFWSALEDTAGLDEPVNLLISTFAQMKVLPPAADYSRVHPSRPQLPT